MGELKGLFTAKPAGEALGTDIGKLQIKDEGRWRHPLAGRPVGSADWWAPPLATDFGQEASWWVPTALRHA